MAYVYENIEQQLNSPSNIFQQNPQGGFRGQPTEAQQDGGIEKTQNSQVAEAQTGGGGSVDAAEPGTVKAKAFEKASAKAKTPSTVAKVTQNIQQAQQNLADEASQYSATQRNQNVPTYDANLASQASQGNENAFGTIAGFLSGVQAPEPEAFKPTATYNAGNTDLLNTQAGTTKYLQKAGPQDYTSGMAEFDSYLLNRNPQFVRDVRNLQDQQDKFDQDRQNYIDTLPQEIQQEAQKANEDLAARYSQDLRGIQQTIDQQALQRAQDQFGQGAALEAIAQSQQDEQALEALAAQYDQTDPLLAAQIRSLPTAEGIGLPTPDQFYTASQFSPTAAYGYSPEMITRFNTIADLLGGESVAGELPPDLTPSFDAPRYQDAVLNWANENVPKPIVSENPFYEEYEDIVLPNAYNPEGITRPPTEEEILSGMTDEERREYYNRATQEYDEGQGQGGQKPFWQERLDQFQIDTSGGKEWVKKQDPRSWVV